MQFLIMGGFVRHYGIVLSDSHLLKVMFIHHHIKISAHVIEMTSVVFFFSFFSPKAFIYRRIHTMPEKASLSSSADC